MAFINFNSENKIEIPSIDNEHAELASIIEKIHESVSASDTPAAKRGMENLLEVLITHFRNEEKLMKENTFPGYYTHKLEHDRFYLQLTDLTNGFIEGARPFGTEQLTSIKQWFFNHIEINDRKCGNFLRDKGIIN